MVSRECQNVQHLTRDNPKKEVMWKRFRRKGGKEELKEAGGCQEECWDRSGITCGQRKEDESEEEFGMNQFRTDLIKERRLCSVG